MKDEGFLVFVGIVMLIAAVFYVEPIDLVNNSPRNNIPTGSQNISKTPTNISSDPLTNIGQQVKDVENRVNTLGEDIATFKKEFGTSKYDGLIQISQIKNSPTSHPFYEYVKIYGSRNIAEPIDITGWTLTSTFTGESVKIPTGTDLYRSNGLSTVTNIKIRPNDTAYISTGRSQIGESFRLNICSGFHEQDYNFVIKLPQQCPYPIEDVTDIYLTPSTEACLDYIEDLPRCIDFRDVPPVELGYECGQYILDDINYESCLGNHISDAGFYRAQWRIFLSEKETLWRSQNETIYLLDTEGKIVDTYTN